MPKYSILIVEGFQKNHVLVDEVLNKKIPEILEHLDVGGVTKVASLPETGEAGKIYYNTTSNTYYLHDGTSYVPVGIVEDTSFPLVPKAGVIYHIVDRATDTDGYFAYDGTSYRQFCAHSYPVVTPAEPAHTVDDTYDTVSYTLQPNKYYSLSGVGGGTDQTKTRVLALQFTPKTNVAEQYVGRVSCDGPVQLQLPAGIHLPDEHPDLEEDHTYEFNILYDTCLITDITYTDNSNS